MQTNRSNAGALIAGIVLILFGLMALAGQLFRMVDWGALWPFIIIGFVRFTRCTVIEFSCSHTATSIIPGPFTSTTGSSFSAHLIVFLRSFE